MASTAPSPVAVRRWDRRDVGQIARLYYETVQTVNARDYSAAQVQAWAPRVYEDGWWLRRFRRYTVLVGEAAGGVVGFAELGAGGQVDCFYVHQDWQGRGVGRALMGRVVAEARREAARRLYADVSITARPFFRRMGFRVQRRQTRRYGGRSFHQYAMERLLD